MTNHDDQNPIQPQTAPNSALDDGTYTAIKEPRLAGKLELDGTWHQISKKYVTLQQLVNIVLFVLVAGAAVVAYIMWDHFWPLIVGGGLALIMLFSIIITPRQARAYGYQLREDDLVFRKGILWQRMVAVPYGRLQLVDITHGPLDRGFNIAQLKLVTAAAATGVSIPGLSQEAAEELRDRLIEVAETRRTGL